MAAFRYNALDAAGKASNGMIEADSARLARTQLRDKGLFVVELDSLSDKPSQTGARSWNLPFRKRIPLSEISLMLRQLATLLEADTEPRHNRGDDGRRSGYRAANGFNVSSQFVLELHIRYPSRLSSSGSPVGQWTPRAVRTSGRQIAVQPPSTTNAWPVT